jgi:hypothetical protein
MSREKVEFVSYDEEYPTLCFGRLVLRIGEKEYKGFRLDSGGCVRFDENYEEHIESGPWVIAEYPEDFPSEYKDEAEEVVNDNVPWGCCGGCV